MAATSGKYISFIDADDYLFDGVYAKFAQDVAAEDVDVYMFNGVTFFLTPDVESSVGYEGKFRKDYQDHTGYVSAKYKF